MTSRVYKTSHLLYSNPESRSSCLLPHLHSLTNNISCLAVCSKDRLVSLNSSPFIFGSCGSGIHKHKMLGVGCLRHVCPLITFSLNLVFKNLTWSLCYRLYIILIEYWRRGLMDRLTARASHPPRIEGCN